MAKSGEELYWLTTMKKSDIIERLENLSVFTACLENQIKDMLEEVKRMFDYLKIIEKDIKISEKNNS